VITVAFCALAACALFVPGFVFGAESYSSPVTTTADPVEGPDPGAIALPIPGLSTGTLLTTLPWGDHPGEVGLAAPTEGLTRGPEALAVASDGRIAVLDSVNRRLVFLDAQGDMSSMAAVPLADPRFLAVDGERVYVLDCDVDRRVVALDWSGGSLGTAALPVLDDVVTGLFATPQGPCVEVAHEAAYLLAGVGCAAAGAKEAIAAVGEPLVTEASIFALPGRPVSEDIARVARVTFSPEVGVRMESYAVDASGLTVSLAGKTSPVLALGQALEHLVSVDGDGDGGLIIGARLKEPSMHDTTWAPLALTRFDATNLTTAAEVMYLRESPFAYLGQPYVVAPDGRVFQAVGSEQGYSILVHDFDTASTGTEPKEAQP
jgi:hypothetical protein